MAAGLTQRLTSSVVLMSVLFAVLVLSLYILSNTAENLDIFGQYYFWLLLADGVVLVFMAVLIASNSFHLLREFRQRVAGSRLTVKLIVMSVFLSLVPVSLVYMFSVKFLRSNIDSFFDVKIEQVLSDTLELSRDSLALQMRVMRTVTNDIAGRLESIDVEDAVDELNEISARVEASELTLIGKNNRVIAATSLIGNLSLLPDIPANDLIARARDGIAYVGVDPVGDGLIIRIIVPVLTGDPAQGNLVLQALYPVDKKSSELAVRVQESYQRYQQMEFLSKPLKLGSILTLSLTLVLSVLTALWFAFYAARRMMVPVHDLVEGTKQVAEGDYSVRIYKQGDDELRYLVDSFNDMTGRLAESDRQARQSREVLENQRAYLETVLRHVSTGVITLDSAGVLRTANDAAGSILGEDIYLSIGTCLLDKNDGDVGHIHQFYLLNEAQINSGQDWSQEVEIFHSQGRRLLLCRGAQLADGAGNIVGVVIVFDDITTIIQAQRNAAWSEVARRLAHEIKNPLTPIQLSAERLRRKYLDKMQGEDAELLDRLTHTIVQQVDAMKSMVKAFADYANTPTAHFERTDVNALVIEVVDLYRDIDGEVDMAVRLGTNLPSISADVTRMRQLLHNVIKNALEAQKESEYPEVLVSTSVMDKTGEGVLNLTVKDRGPGFPVELLDKLFEPYVTSKPKGTGLGLAIVKKIVEEHNGIVYAQNRDGGGGSIIMHFPLPSAVSHGVETE